MFWEEELKMPKEMYLNSRPVMYACRVLGYFPISIKRNKSTVVLKWSPFYAIYSYALGAFLIIGTYWQNYRRFVNTPMTAMTPIHIFTTFAGFTGWVSALFCGMFVMTTRVQSFFAYIKCLNEVDLALNTTYTKLDKYYTTLIFVAAFIPTTASLIADYILDIGLVFDLWRLIKQTGLPSVIKIVAVTITYIIWHLVHSLTKRILILNRLLEIEDYKHQRVTKHMPIQVRGAFIALYNGTHTEEETLGETLIDDGSITKLTRIYLKLCDAVDLLDHIINETVTAGILGPIIQTLHPAYFLLVFIDGTGIPRFTQAALFNIIMNLVWEIFIIDSCYFCCQQIKTTEKLVCQLLSWDTNLKYKLKVKRFALCLGLRRIEFSACGFFAVDRTLFTDMLSTYTTVLMFLLQLHQDEE